MHLTMLQHLSVRNMTRDAMAWAASPVGRLVRVEVLVILSCSGLALLVFLGSGRRSSRSATFRLAVWSALMLSYPTVSYTIGLMQSACSFRNELTVTWGCFLLLTLGCADGIAAFNLNDTDQQTRTMLNQALQIVYVLILLVSYVSYLPGQLKVLLFLLWSLSTIKLAMRVRSFLLASRELVLNDENKLIADYMLHEPELAGTNYDATKMKGYNYIVAGETDIDNGGDDDLLLEKVKEGEVVTVDTVWRCERRVLNSEDSSSFSCQRRKDLCLSFALFKLLRRRITGHQLHESRLCKTRDFVNLGLLGSSERMYRVIEVELGFLFDLYYTRYPASPKETLVLDTVIFVAVLATTVSTFFCSALFHYHASRAGNSSITATTLLDIWLTRGIIIFFLAMESFQYLTLVFSDWHKVKMLCRYVQRDSWQKNLLYHTILKAMCHVKLMKYWKDAVGQFNVLHACIRQKNSCILCKGLLPKWAKDLMAPRILTEQRALTETVKVAIHSYLQSGGLLRIRHGECVLEQHRMLPKLPGQSVAHAGTARGILTWHIATTMCDLRYNNEVLVDQNHEVAITISDYCAYLLLSAPELLPGHHHETKLFFGRVRECAEKHLNGCLSKNEIYRKLARMRADILSSPGVASTMQEADVQRQKMSSYELMLAEGAELGIQVLNVMPQVGMQWKMLAELRVEILLSVAPAGNMTSHVQWLPTGGELITHLWALLTHAGVVETPNSHRRRISA